MLAKQFTNDLQQEFDGDFYPVHKFASVIGLSLGKVTPDILLSQFFLLTYIKSKL